jgi:hypothetical protein
MIFKRRRFHDWRIRCSGFRDLLLANRWLLCGAYARKTIAGAEVTQFIRERHAGHLVVRFLVRGT